MSDIDSSPFKEIPLTERGHMDPDKHWIGETLAPPTQTEIAATIGSSSGPGDSPYVARANHTHKLSTSEIFSIAGIRSFLVTLNDDQAGYFPFTPNTDTQWGIAVISCNTPSAVMGIVGFRSGDANAYCSVIASAGGTLTGGTGSMGGTTGADGQLHVRGYATFTRLYIENRTGAQRLYTVTFLSLFNTTCVPSAFFAI